MAVKSTSQQYRVSQVVLVPIWYLPGRAKENKEKICHGSQNLYGGKQNTMQKINTCSLIYGQCPLHWSLLCSSVTLTSQGLYIFSGS